jgi:serine/threonine-protein kinase
VPDDEERAAPIGARADSRSRDAWRAARRSRTIERMPLRALPGLGRGEIIADRYEIIGKLGSGGMGDVYEVQHRLLGRRFALKRLAPDLTTDTAMVERFLREARVAAATNHPAVVEVFDLGFAAEGWPFLVMERLNGETVRARMRRGPIDEPLAIHIGVQVLGALGAAHAAGVIHRDIKPENLYLCAGEGALPEVKVLDFGLALLTGDRTDLRLTQSGVVMGTPLYMSPEQARGGEVDLGTDLYSLGAVLFEALARRPPFEAEVYSVLIAQILEDTPPWDALAATAELRAVIAHALAKRRVDRFTDAAEMRAALAGLALAPSGAHAVAASRPAWTDPHTRTTVEVSAPQAAFVAALAAEANVLTPASGPRAQRERSSPVVLAPSDFAPGAAPIATLPPRDPADDAPTDPAEVAPADARGSARPTAPIRGQSQPVRPADLAVERALSPPRAEPAADRAHRWRWPILIAAILSAAATAALVVIVTRSTRPSRAPAGSAPLGSASQGSAAPPPAPPVAPPVAPGWQAALDDGRLGDARDQLAAAFVRSPDSGELAARALLIDLILADPAAADHAARLNGRTAPPLLADALAAAAAVRRGDPIAAAEALSGELRAVPPGSVDDRVIRLARAALYRRGERGDLAATEDAAILDRAPAFGPALAPLLADLYREDDAAALARATHLVDAYATAAPGAPDLALVRARLAYAQRAYGDALAHLERHLAAHPGDATVAAMRGDLLVLTGHPDAAVGAYAALAEPGARAIAIAGAYMHADGDPTCSLTKAIAAYPPRGPRAGLAALVFETALLARVDEDHKLARVALAGLPAIDPDPDASAARAFAAAVVRGLGDPVDDPPDPLDVRAFLIADAFGKIDLGVLPQLDAVTAPDALARPGVSPEVAPVLLFMRAQGEALAGDSGGALATLARVLEPAVYRPSRGLIYVAAVKLRAQLLEQTGHAAQAREVKKALAAQTNQDVGTVDDCPR